MAKQLPPGTEAAAVRRFAEVRPGYGSNLAAIRAVAAELAVSESALANWVYLPRNVDVAFPAGRAVRNARPDVDAAIRQVFEALPNHRSKWAAVRAVAEELGISPHTLQSRVNAVADVDTVMRLRGMSKVLSLARQRVLNGVGRFTVHDDSIKRDIAALQRRVVDDAKWADTPAEFRPPGGKAMPELVRSYQLRAQAPGGRTPVGVVFAGSKVALQTKAAMLADSTPLGCLRILDQSAAYGRTSSFLHWQYRTSSNQPRAVWVASPLARGPQPIVIAGHAGPDGFSFLVEEMDRPRSGGFGLAVPDRYYRTERVETAEFVQLLTHNRYLDAAVEAHPHSPILLRMKADTSELQLIADTFGRDVYGLNGYSHTFTLQELRSTTPWARPFSIGDDEFTKVRESLGAASADWSVTAVWVEPIALRVPDPFLRCTPRT